MLKQRDSIHSSFTVSRSIANLSGSGSGHFSNGSSSKVLGEDYKTDSPGEDGSSDSKDKSSKKRWFNLNLKGSDKKNWKVDGYLCSILDAESGVVALLAKATGRYCAAGTSCLHIFFVLFVSLCFFLVHFVFRQVRCGIYRYCFCDCMHDSCDVP